MRTALDVHRELLARAVPHEIVRLGTRIATADDLPEVLGLETGCLAVRVYRVTRRAGRPCFAAVLLPVGAVPHAAALLQALDAASVRPATPGEVNTATDYPAELVSPVGLPADVEVLADTAVGGDDASGGGDVVYTAAGEGGVALGIRVRDLLATVGARSAALTRVPVPQPRDADVVDLGPDLQVHLDQPVVRRAPAHAEGRGQRRPSRP